MTLEEKKQFLRYIGKGIIIDARTLFEEAVLLQTEGLVVSNGKGFFTVTEKGQALLEEE